MNSNGTIEVRAFVRPTTNVRLVAEARAAGLTQKLYNGRLLSDAVRTLPAETDAQEPLPFANTSKMKRTPPATFIRAWMTVHKASGTLDDVCATTGQSRAAVKEMVRKLRTKSKNGCLPLPVLPGEERPDREPHGAPNVTETRAERLRRIFEEEGGEAP